MYLNFFLARLHLVFENINSIRISLLIQFRLSLQFFKFQSWSSRRQREQLQQKHISTKSWQTHIGMILAKLQNILSPENGRKWQNRDFRDLQPIIRIICKGVRVHLHLGQCTMAISYFTNDPRFVGFEIRFFFQEVVAYQLHVYTATYSSIRM